MSNQVVILSTESFPDNSFVVSGVFWLTVPANSVTPTLNFQSRVAVVDQVTLAALRLGTLVEQPFTSIQYPAGTTQNAVQTEVLGQFAAAQAIVTASASPVSGLVGTAYTGSSWITVPTPVFDPMSRLVTDMYWAAGSGLIPGVTAGRSTGYCTTSAMSNKAILATTYTPQITNAQRSIVSTSALDTNGGTGANQVTVTYLDATFNVHTEVVTLNGTVAVNTVGTNWAYIESIVVTQVGSTGTNQGTISVMTATSGGGSAWASIAVNSGVGDNQTFYAHHYVPTGVTCYVLSMECASYGVMGTMYLAHSGNPSATNLPFVQIGPTVLHPSGDYREHDFQTALAVPGPDMIQLFTRPSAVTSDTSLGNFEYIQF